MSKRAPKASIKCNVWGNWYGYHGCKKVEMFFGWQEREANEWLAAQAAKGYRV